MDKQCTKCKKWLSFTSFHRHKDGLKPRCKECRCKAQVEYDKSNPEKKRERDKKYSLKNQDKIKERSQKYRKENIEEIKIRNAEYRTKNKEKLRKYFRDHYQENRDKKLKQAAQYAANKKDLISKYSKKYRQENFKKLKDYQKRARKENRDRHRIYGLSYIARKNNAEGEFTVKQWQDLCEFFNSTCPCCKEEVDKFEADHIIPLTWGNTSNNITNIQPLCKSCNSSKCNYHNTDYRPEYVVRWAQDQLKIQEALLCQQ